MGKTDPLEHVMEYNVDVENRCVYLLGDIDNESICQFIKSIHYLVSLDDVSGIQLFIGSYGGVTYDMLAAYDIITSIAVPVSTIALGKCMSAAVLLVAAGDPKMRYAMPNTQFMLHMGEPTRSDQSHYRQMLSEGEHNKSLITQYEILLAGNSARSKAYWQCLLESPYDHFFDVQTAITYGLIDSIWQ